MFIINSKYFSMNYQSDIFNPAAIYNMLFFDLKTVLEHPTLDALQQAKPEMYGNWLDIMREKFNTDNSMSLETLYDEYAINYPEYCRIVTITYAKVYMNETAGKMDRVLKKVTGENEAILLETFFDELNNVSDDNTMLVSFNGNKDIQTLVKRFIYRRSELNTIKTLPKVIKRVIGAKAWETGVIDINNVWKFNNYEYNQPSFSVISDFIGLKKNVDLLSNNGISNYYWNNIETKQDECLKHIELQSMNHTNMLIQFINEVRNL